VAAAVLIPVAAVAEAGSEKHLDFAAAHREVTRKFRAATAEDDVILAKILFHIDRAVVPTWGPSPLGLVRAFSVSARQGQAQTELLRRQNPDQVEAFHIQIRAPKSKDSAEPAPEQVAKAFRAWQQDKRQIFGGSAEQPLALSSQTVMEACRLASTGHLGAVVVDFAQASDDLLPILDACPPGLQFIGSRKLTAAALEWMGEGPIQKLKWTKATEDCIEPVLAVVAQSHDTLVEMVLYDCTVGKCSGKYLRQAIVNHNSLERMELGVGNSLGVEGMRHVAEGIKNSQSLRFLNFFWTKIQGEAPKYLADAIAANTSLRHVNVSNAWLSTDGVVSLALGFRKSTTVKHVQIGRNKFDQAGAEAWALTIKENTMIDQLDLSSTQLKTERLAVIIEALKINSVIWDLNLSGNEFGDAGIKSLAAGLKDSKVLRRILLAGTQITEAGAGDLAILLSIVSLEEVNLKDLDLGQGITLVANAIGRSSSIRDVNLARNKLGDHGIEAVCEAIRECKTLAELNLSENGAGTKAAESLAEAVPQSKSIRHLDLSWNQFSEEALALEHLGKMIAGSATLQHLDLSGNRMKVKDTGMMQKFSEGLKESKSLEQLRLKRMYFEDEELKGLAAGIAANRSLRFLDLTSTTVGKDDGMKHLCAALEENSTLETVLLTNNWIRDGSVKFFVEALKKSPALTYLDLEGNHFAEDEPVYLLQNASVHCCVTASVK